MKNRSFGRLISAFLALCMLCILLPVTAHAGFVNIKDTSASQNVFTAKYGLAYSLSDGQQKLINYDVPAGGASVLIFFRGDGSCGNSRELISTLSAARWARESNVNFVAVDSSSADRSTVQSFMREHDPNGVIDSTYYDPGRSLTWYWFKKFVESNGDPSQIYGNAGISYAYAVILTQSGSSRYIRFSEEAIDSAYELQDALAELITLNGVEPTVNVTVAGSKRYEYVQSVLASVNQHRSSSGSAALTLSGRLTEMAMQRAAECAVSYSHTRPNGRSCFSVIKEMGGYETYAAAENIAAGYTSPDAVMTGWINSAGHRANILNSDFTQIGVGCFESNGKLYWAQLFGDGSDTTSPASVKTPADVPVNMLEKHLDLYLSSESGITLNVGATAELPKLYQRNTDSYLRNNGFAALLRPQLADVTAGAGRVIASVQYGAVGTGSARITGISAGSELLPLRAGAEQTSPLSVRVTVLGGSGTGVSLQTESGADFTVGKMLRSEGMSRTAGGTGEPDSYGYDPDNISMTLILSGVSTPNDALTALNGATFERAVRNAGGSIVFERLTGSISGNTMTLSHTSGGKTVPVMRIRAYVQGGVHIELTSLAPGAVRLTLEGREYLLATPGDVNLDGTMNALDWITIMRWTLVASGGEYTSPNDEGFTIKVNDTDYNLWVLLADMTDTETDNSKNSANWGAAVNAVDWITIMQLTLQAWK